MIEFKLLNSSHLEQVMKILNSHANASAIDFSRFGLNWSEEQIKKALASDIGFGLFESEKLVAFILGRKINESTFEIDMTMTEFQNLKKGFMERLFQESLSHMKSCGPLDEVWLEVHEENLAALTFYKKRGFIENAMRPKYYSDGKGALLMTLRCLKS